MRRFLLILAAACGLHSAESRAAPPSVLYESCKAVPGARAPTLTPTASDEPTRAANTAAINSAIAAGPGTVCLPPGVFYLTNRVGGTEALWIAVNDLTLRGAGQYDGTHLVTRSDWNLDARGAVFRGQGLRIAGSADPAAPQTNITIQDLELDGGLEGFTGDFNWPANPTTGEGWDVSHKGLIPAWDTATKGVVLRNLYVHDYRGEIIYAGGHDLSDVVVDTVRAEDTNGSDINITSNFTVTNSYFGRASIWMEIGMGGAHNSSVWERNVFKDAARYGVNMAQGDGATGKAHIFRGNLFDGCGADEAAFFFGGGIAGPVLVERNVFKSCSGFVVGRAHNDKSWGAYENRGITVQDNLLLDAPTLAYFQQHLADSLVRRNTLINTGAVGVSTATKICGTNISNVAVLDNTFVHTRSPEQMCDVTAGTRPLYAGNSYSATEDRDQQGSGMTITPSWTWVKPITSEQISVVTNAANIVTTLTRSRHPDGQVITITGGSPAKPLKFSTGNTSYSVGAARSLTGGSIRFRFDAAINRWLEIM